MDNPAAVLLWRDFCIIAVILFKITVMRNLKLVLSLFTAAIIYSGCVTTHPGGNPHGLPPGQQKKIYGTKSAKPFAPGQQKKQ
ncbi:hypothetical protein SAMN05660461_3956 [Chitinophaga ginsengisegetis]|uniref:Quinol oxidase subunit 4 n=2 Tax=Chitinophagaceae TaxID=563835 RepID=A0A1T5P5M6_9BACT|nr:hypothetical protein SAMN05660461_3956 [Chitinophaga ginsengisegetis]